MAITGDTIMVCPGTYSELVHVTNAVTLLGAQAGVHGATAGRGINSTESIVDERRQGWDSRRSS